MMSLDAPTLLLAGVAALIGTGAGWLHFASLSRVAAMFVEGRLSAVGLQVVRLALLVLLLCLFVREGAIPLLACALGVLAGRALVMRRAG